MVFYADGFFQFHICAQIQWFPLGGGAFNSLNDLTPPSMLRTDRFLASTNGGGAFSLCLEYWPFKSSNNRRKRCIFFFNVIMNVVTKVILNYGNSRLTLLFIMVMLMRILEKHWVKT